MKAIAKWTLGGVLAVGLVAAGVAVAPLVTSTSLLGDRSDTSNTQVIQAITRTEQISLLSLGIHGLETRSDRKTFAGMDIPGTERSIYIEYSFNAKLGIDGADVQIDQTGDQVFTITIPEFIFIGHDNVNVRVPVETNGVLSWATPEIQETELVNHILNADAQTEYIKSNQEILRDQAEAFYRGIIKAVDPSVQVVFEFESH